MENYFWNTEEIKTEKKVYILVIYDIVNNKCRTDFAKKMNGYGFRVQKSAFEAMVSERAGEVNLFGINQEIKNEEVIII